MDFLAGISKGKSGFLSTLRTDLAASNGRRRAFFHAVNIGRREFRGGLEAKWICFVSPSKAGRSRARVFAAGRIWGGRACPNYSAGRQVVFAAGGIAGFERAEAAAKWSLLGR